MPELAILGPSGDKRHLSLGAGEYVLGRDPNAAITLKASKVSRRHARIWTEGGHYWLEDLGSANGTFCGGKRLSGRLALEDGVEFEIAGFRLTFRGDAATSLSLIGLTSPCTGGRFPLSGGENDVGRADSCTITLRDPSVSRQHAMLTLVAGNVTVRDLGSSNGTFVNGKRVDSAVLRLRDKVRFGKVEVRLVDPASERPRRRRLGHLSPEAYIAFAAAPVVVLALLYAMSGRAKGAMTQYEESLTIRLAAAAELENKEEWEPASRAYQAVLDDDPINTQARRGLEKAELNRKHKLILQAAERDLAAGAAEDALSRLVGVPNDALYGERAVLLAQRARALLAKKALDTAQAACTKGDYRVCHREVVQHLENDPTSSAGTALVAEAEHALRVRGIAFTPWQGNQTSPTTTAALRARYTDTALRDVVVRYTAGELAAALKGAKALRRKEGAEAVAAQIAQVQELQDKAKQAAGASDHRAAASLLQQALDIDAQLVPAAYPNVMRSQLGRRAAIHLYALGEEASNRGSWHEAFAHWQAAVRAAPHDELAHAGVLRLERRAEEILAGIGKSPSAAECARLDEVLSTTLPDTESNKRAAQLKKDCKP